VVGPRGRRPPPPPGPPACRGPGPRVRPGQAETVISGFSGEEIGDIRPLIAALRPRQAGGPGGGPTRRHHKVSFNGGFHGS
jgi:hypothetical protein